jgi:hypothetical protein
VELHGDRVCQPRRALKVISVAVLQLCARVALPTCVSQPRARPSAARPRMAADGAEGGLALKGGLGRLLSREALRDQIERTA